MTLALASNNPHKAVELGRIFRDHEIVTAPDLGLAFSHEETGRTYLENALGKARHAAVHTQLPCFADDSGLEVDALDGAPGLYSARFDGAHGTPESRNAKLLRLLSGVPWSRRTARFRAVVAFVRPRPGGRLEEETFSGVLEGVIATEPGGEGGFGYDPVFWVPSLGCTVACLDARSKDRVSHRGQAMRQLARHLAGLVGGAGGR